MLFTKVKAYYDAVGVARKHFVNWPELVVNALLKRSGVFRSRGGGDVSIDAKMLLRKFTRIEHEWRLWGDVFPHVRFENNSIVIPNYFGRDFRVPLNVESVTPPSFYLKLHYPFEVMDEIVLDIGAYLGDTVLMWLYKGARTVIAVEPLPLHYQYLERNVDGLPVICLKASLAVQLPYIPTLEGRLSYGLSYFPKVKANKLNQLNSPIVQLISLVHEYHPTFVKIDCEGCEYYILEQLWQLPSFGVKKIAVEFHEWGDYKLDNVLNSLREKLGGDFKMWRVATGAHVVYWYKQ
jgi:FkbM family methyltransferase